MMMMVLQHCIYTIEHVRDVRYGSEFSEKLRNHLDLRNCPPLTYAEDDLGAARFEMYIDLEEHSTRQHVCVTTRVHIQTRVKVYVRLSCDTESRQIREEDCAIASERAHARRTKAKTTNRDAKGDVPFHTAATQMTIGAILPQPRGRALMCVDKRQEIARAHADTRRCSPLLPCLRAAG